MSNPFIPGPEESPKERCGGCKEDMKELPFVEYVESEAGHYNGAEVDSLWVCRTEGCEFRSLVRWLEGHKGSL